MDLTFGPFVGEDVVIRYDPRDIGEIRVYHQGVFLCRAVCAELTGGSYSYKEVNEMNSKGGLLREQKREIKAAAGKLLALRNSSGPAEWADHPERSTDARSRI